MLMEVSSNGTPVGRVVGLWRYPVKSMGAESLTHCDVSWHGLAGDRRWAFVRNSESRSGFPWLTLRERGDMGRYQPSFAEPTRPDHSPVAVRTPARALFDVTDAALAEELHPAGARAIKYDRGLFDTFALSLITTQTIDQLAQAVALPLDVQRFRPNFLVDVFSGEAFAEDGWVGQVLRIGGLRMRVDKRDGRCVVITIDPVTSQREPAILRKVASDRQGTLGVYGSTVQPGRVALNDLVWVEAPAQAP
jgi:uncharacterized protein